jgi:hypothetical protein
VVCWLPTQHVHLSLPHLAHLIIPFSGEIRIAPEGMVKDRLRQHHLNDLRFVRSLSAGELFLVMSRLGLKPRTSTYK